MNLPADKLSTVKEVERTLYRTNNVQSQRKRNTVMRVCTMYVWEMDFSSVT